MAQASEQFKPRSKTPFVAAALTALAAIGLVDYLTGFQLYFSVFYLLAVGLAAWYVGAGFATAMSLLSVVVAVGGDLAAGASYSTPFVPIWNAVILLVFYLVVVWLLARLRALQFTLESRVRDRTAELRREMAERQRLEEEILQIGEREQRRIGHELHDTLCQHLTATALAGQVLAEKLGAQSRPESGGARQVVDLIEQGIDLARNLARGLYPVEMEAEGLMAAFQQLANSVTQAGRGRCLFECATPVLIHDDAAATHLYRIAQEAVLNAVRHGKAKQIGIGLAERNGAVTLTVEDDGVGMPEGGPGGPGLGLRIMAHRAAMIGGTFSIEPGATGGTTVTCAFRTPAAPAQSAVL
jgi:signal transduction histidine kinase